MRTTILGLATASLATAAIAVAAEPEQTTYGDVAKVISSAPVYAKGTLARRECRLEKTGYNTAALEDGPAAEIPRCDEKGEGPERVVAYDVTYEYNGHQFRVRMPFDPGERMAVNIEVRPPLPRAPYGARPPRYRGPY